MDAPDLSVMDLQQPPPRRQLIDAQQPGFGQIETPVAHADVRALADRIVAMREQAARRRADQPAPDRAAANRLQGEQA